MSRDNGPRKPPTLDGVPARAARVILRTRAPQGYGEDRDQAQDHPIPRASGPDQSGLHQPGDDAARARRTVLGIVHHVGRRSGKAYASPVLVAVRRDSIVIPLMYGLERDWVRNLRHAGTFTLTFRGASSRASTL